MLNAHILGTGSYLPMRRMSNDDLSKIVDTSDEWITSRTGIKARHIAAENEQTSDLAVKAAQAALADAGIVATDIDPRYDLSGNSLYRSKQAGYRWLSGI